MIQLSFEILKLIFTQLEVKDLLQCQSTSKQWYDASVDLLYSKVTIDDDPRSALFTRTITTSPQLGRYLRFIDVGSLLGEKEMISCMTDLNELLNALLQYCPNLLELNVRKANHNLWTRLTYAANQGQLSRLQRLPTPSTGDPGGYIYTALALKKTLKTLTLYGETPSSNRFPYTTFYKTILNNLKEFSNLQHLEVEHNNNQHLSYWDKVIEDCPHLKSLRVFLIPITERQTTKTFNKFFLQRFDIEKLECDWEIIRCNDQLKYIISKFPRLQFLKISLKSYLFPEYSRESGRLCFSGLNNFLEYISNIPKIDIKISLRTDKWTDLWFDAIKMTNCLGVVRVYYQHHLDKSNSKIVHLQKNFSSMKYIINNTENVLPHFLLLYKTGNIIKSLIIELKTPSLLSKYKIVCTDSWLYQSLNLCPYLQELTISRPVGMDNDTDIFFQHTKLQSLFVKEVMRNDRLDFLERLSSNAPNLKRLSLRYAYEYDSMNCDAIKINMPFTRFSLIKWTILGDQETIRDTLQYFIKLNTVMYAKYFFCNKDGLSPVNQIQYEMSSRPLSFVITCEVLTEFRLIVENRFQNKIYVIHKWNF